MSDSTPPRSLVGLGPGRATSGGGREGRPRSGRHSPESASVAVLAKALIDDSFRSRISLATLSRHCNVSREHLCRVFKSRYSVTVTDYVRSRRIQEALSLMRDPDLQLKKVGLAVGYANYNEFFRAFKRVTQLTPSLYLQRQHAEPLMASMEAAE